MSHQPGEFQMATGHAQARNYLFSMSFKEQIIKKLKFINPVWMSRPYWPLVITFLDFFQHICVMLIKTSRSNGLFSSNKAHLFPRGKDFPATNLNPLHLSQTT